MSLKLELMVRALLTKINAVTSPYRHGRPISRAAMVELCNRQVEIEEQLRVYNENMIVKDLGQIEFNDGLDD